jgi:hypothetical protein
MIKISEQYEEMTCSSNIMDSGVWQADILNDHRLTRYFSSED